MVHAGLRSAFMLLANQLFRFFSQALVALAANPPGTHALSKVHHMVAYICPSLEPYTQLGGG